MSKDRENRSSQALINKDYETIKVLLASENAKELVHSFDPEKSVLHFAAENGYTDLLKRIADLGININIKDQNGQTPLHVATILGHPDTVSQLLKLGANIEAKDETHRTALHFAAESGHIYSAIELLNNGANPNALTKIKSTPLHLAAEAGHQDIIIELLIRGADIEAQDYEGLTPLCYGADNSHLGIIIELINRGASINAKYIDNPSIPEAVKHLLSAGLLIDEIYDTPKKENIPQNLYSDQIVILLPRLKHLIKTSGLPNHFLDSNNIHESIRPQVINILGELKDISQTVQETIEPYLAIIVNKLYPKQFPSHLPYSQAIKYSTQFSSSSIYSHLTASYKQTPHLTPQEFLTFMLDPNNNSATMGLFLQCPHEAILLVSAMNKIPLPPTQLDLFSKFKQSFDCYISRDKYLVYLNDQIDKSLASNNNNPPKSTNQLNDETEKKGQKNESSNQLRTDHKLHNESRTGTKRKAESYVEFIENERESVKAKYQERGR